MRPLLPPLCRTAVSLRPVALICVLLGAADSSKFQPCGGRPGVVTASKSAALGARFLATCTDMLLKHAFEAQAVTKASAGSVHPSHFFRDLE
ncbi:hypothetical protein V5799_029505 [Amblyomma americanum]|uniref:Secreted protein n=1 Tax=Amblyomma americanum TaxID=6943 RepID=A0AAQ4EQU3_AMBAM